MDRVRTAAGGRAHEPMPRRLGIRLPARPIGAVAGGQPERATDPRPDEPLRIFQIYYEPWHIPLLDPAFSPLDNRGTPDALLEFAVFERLAASPSVAGAELWGALSWRFAEKTGLSGRELIAAITARPGHDIYYCNPFPQHEALYHNLWAQGETAHPGLIDLTRAWLAAAGLSGDALAAIEPGASYSTANYFVGTPRFWTAYLAFVRTALDRADASLPASIRDALHSSAGDSKGVHGGASYLPFIVERLFGLFMRTAGQGLSGCRVPLPEIDAELDVHLRLLRDMKDTAHRSRSPWLAACWVNYRNLYLKQQHGSAWCRKYLRVVTPAEIHFA